MTDQLQAEQERQERNIRALIECLKKGVSAESVWQLSFEAGIHINDIEFFLNKQEAA